MINLAPQILTCDQVQTTFVIKDGGTYSPLFTAKDVNRDQFFHLRSQLIKLGCSKDEVLQTAQRISMDVLQIKNFKEYQEYILQDTYQKCRKNIAQGYELNPMQDIQNPEYSHTHLFSSIYGFEIEYLKQKGIFSGIADIGCGEGLFTKLAYNHELNTDGYEIKIPNPCHDVPMYLIKNYYDIAKPYQCLIYNHVLEHIPARPDIYIRQVLDYFLKKMQNKQLNTIMVSLPMHTDIPAHLASKHHWVCTENYFMEDAIKTKFLREGLRMFNPSLHFEKVAKDYGYRLMVKNNLGLYVFEKN
jgi:hypothetical protein